MRLARWAIHIGVMALLLGAPTGSIKADDSPDALKHGFADPPPAAWPRTWWHWTGGQVTKEGITKDLEWMHRVGIAGFQLADVSFGGGQTVEPPVEYGSAEWRDAVRHAAAEAKRLGLEMTVFSSPGWSITGGPWVEPHQAMKKLVWSEIEVEGPREFRERLPQPPNSEGAFQDMGASRGGGANFYRDVRVLAFRNSADRVDEQSPEVASHAGAIDGAVLTDGSYDKAITIDAPEDGSPAWVEFTFAEPITVQAVTIAGGGGIPVGRIAASGDGQTYRTVVALPGAQLYRQGRVRTFAFPKVRARHFRMEMSGGPLGPAATMSEEQPQPAKQYSLLEWRLHPAPRVHRWEEKAAFGHLFEYESVTDAGVGDTPAISSDDVVDLTPRMSPEGHLEWDVPDGKWTVLRLGYSLTGAKNRPASPGGVGYEVDKLSRQHTEDYYDGYRMLLKRAVGDLYGSSLQCFLIDSWEAGQQNWTDDMIAEFTRRRDYDPTPYLPALVGRVVDDRRVSDRFLWDFRRTLADMFAENHYGVMSERLHDDGLRVYSEAAGVSLEIPEDTLLNKSKVDIPMGEFWVRDLHPRLMYLQDVRGAASAAHTYGKPIVAAEAFTGGRYESPFSLKKVSDYWLAQGINQLVFHTSAHQPLDTKPGNTMVGTHLHRNITWADLARPLNTYFARVCYMLQQGRAVADIAYLLNEGAPSTMPIWGTGTRPACPEGYDNDFINADVLLHRLEVADDGRLVLPDGMSYRVLVLPESRQMRPELLEKLHHLVTGGATVVGPRPVESPSLSNQPAADRRVAELADVLWGDLNGTTRTINYVGKGMVVWGRTLGDVLARLDVKKDFEWAGPLDTDVAWKHRRTSDADIYYVSNLTARPVTLEMRFRVAQRESELWHPDTGEIVPSSYSQEGDRSIVPVNLGANETLFVVFRGAATQPAREVSTRRPAQVAEITGEWEVTFSPGLGDPDRLTMSSLKSWTEYGEPGVRYFSGTATYSISLNAPATWFSPGRELLLSLGEVHDLAEVLVNGKPLGILWKPPYQVDVTEALHTGENRLEVRVTNQWTNRIMGDRAEDGGGRVLTDADKIFFRPPDDLETSGLLGPIEILAIE